MSEQELEELKESEENGRDWFNSYGDVDNFLFEQLDKIGKEFPIIDKDKPQLNTIEAVKLLTNCG